MNQALPSLHEKSLEITRTVPVRRRPDGTLLFRNIYVYLDTLKEYVMSIWTHSRSRNTPWTQFTVCMCSKDNLLTRLIHKPPAELENWIRPSISQRPKGTV